MFVSLADSIQLFRFGSCVSLNLRPKGRVCNRSRADSGGDGVKKKAKMTFCGRATRSGTQTATTASERFQDDQRDRLVRLNQKSTSKPHTRLRPLCARLTIALRNSRRTHSVKAATAMQCAIGVIGLMSSIGVVASVSRLTWAFARDGGLPYSKFFAHVRFPICQSLGNLNQP